MSPREVSIDELAEDMRELRLAIDRLNETIGRDYVRKDVYSSDQAKLVGDVGGSRAIGMWALGLVCALVVSSLVAFVAQIAGGGG